MRHVTSSFFQVAIYKNTPFNTKRMMLPQPTWRCLKFNTCPKMWTSAPKQHTQQFTHYLHLDWNVWDCDIQTQSGINLWKHLSTCNPWCLWSRTARWEINISEVYSNLQLWSMICKVLCKVLNLRNIHLGISVLII